MKSITPAFPLTLPTHAKLPARDRRLGKIYNNLSDTGRMGVLVAILALAGRIDIDVADLILSLVPEGELRYCLNKDLIMHVVTHGLSVRDLLRELGDDIQ